MPRETWLTGGHGRSRGSGKVGRRATLARFTGHPEWRLAFRTDALRPGRDPDELAPLLAVLSDRCPDCGALDGAAGREEGRALDVEAIASHEGRLLVGLRAPLSGEQAVVFAVDPTALQSGASLNDVVVAAWALPLGGRGVRDLASSPSGSLLVLAGGASAAEMPGTALYAWTPGTAPALLGTLPGAGSPASARSMVRTQPGCSSTDVGSEPGLCQADPMRRGRSSLRCTRCHRLGPRASGPLGG